MVLKKILLLWLWVLFDGDDSYTLLGFTIATILLFLLSWFVIVANIQITALIDFI